MNEEFLTAIPAALLTGVALTCYIASKRAKNLQLKKFEQSPTIARPSKLPLAFTEKVTEDKGTIWEADGGAYKAHIRSHRPGSRIVVELNSVIVADIWVDQYGAGFTRAGSGDVPGPDYIDGWRLGLSEARSKRIIGEYTLLDVVFTFLTAKHQAVARRGGWLPKRTELELVPDLEDKLFSRAGL